MKIESKEKKEYNIVLTFDEIEFSALLGHFLYVQDDSEYCKRMYNQLCQFVETLDKK